MAVKTSGGGHRARANPTEALIPENRIHYMDRYDNRWRGSEPYIGLGNRTRNEIVEHLSESVRWMLPGDLLGWSGLWQWADTHFPGYDPDMDPGVDEEVSAAIGRLIGDGFPPSPRSI